MQAELYTATECVRKLKKMGVTRTWLVEKTESGEAPHLRIGARVLYNPDAVAAFVLEQASGKYQQQALPFAWPLPEG